MSHIYQMDVNTPWEMGPLCRRMALVACCLIALSGYAIGQSATVRSTGSARQVIANAKLGLFVHYVFGLTQAAPGEPPLASVNDFCNSLNVNNIANTAKAMGAQYVIFTSMHWRMTLLYPSKVWGAIFPNHVCERDVIQSLARALAAAHIRLILYVHPDDRHDFTKAMMQKLIHAGFSSPSYSGGEPYDPKWNRLYYRLLNEISQRYGKEISGYIEDDGGGSSNGGTVKKIMERYTPGAAIWVNGDKSYPPATLIGGESDNHTLFDTNPVPHIYNTSKHMVAIVIANGWWAHKGMLVYTPDSMYRFLICSIATQGEDNGGVVYATSPFSDNQWEGGVRTGLDTLGRLMKKNAKAIYNTVPSRAYISGESADEKAKWGVATDSRSGKTVYLHILMPPSGRTLQIGRPADGVTFGRASLLNGAAVAMRADNGGYRLTLPHGTRWNPIDTVIALSVDTHVSAVSAMRVSSRVTR